MKERFYTSLSLTGVLILGGFGLFVFFALGSAIGWGYVGLGVLISLFISINRW